MPLVKAPGQASSVTPTASITPNQQAILDCNPLFLFPMDGVMVNSKPRNIAAVNTDILSTTWDGNNPAVTYSLQNLGASVGSLFRVKVARSDYFSWSSLGSTPGLHLALASEYTNFCFGATMNAFANWQNPSDGSDGSQGSGWLVYGEFQGFSVASEGGQNNLYAWDNGEYWRINLNEKLLASTSVNFTWSINTTGGQSAVYVNGLRLTTFNITKAQRGFAGQKDVRFGLTGGDNNSRGKGVVWRDVWMASSALTIEQIRRIGGA